MERLLRRLPLFSLAIGLAIVCQWSNGFAQQVKEVEQQLSLEQLEEAASQSIETGKPILVYMFDTT